MSNNSGNNKKGRVIMGLQSKGLDELDREAEASSSRIPPESEDEFILRVKNKAQDKASQILNQALEESEQIRQRAAQEGYDQGKTQAQQEIEKLKKEQSQQLDKLLNQLQQGKQEIWNQYREDLVWVLKACLEKILGKEIQAHNPEILENLLRESLDLLESTKELTISVNKKDLSLIQELVEKADSGQNELSKCKIKSSSEIKKGGLVLEDGLGMVDNTLDSRYHQIKSLVDQLSLHEEES